MLRHPNLRHRSSLKNSLNLKVNLECLGLSHSPFRWDHYTQCFGLDFHHPVLTGASLNVSIRRYPSQLRPSVQCQLVQYTSSTHRDHVPTIAPLISLGPQTPDETIFLYPIYFKMADHLQTLHVATPFGLASCKHTHCL